MCIYGHFDTRASNRPEPLFQPYSSRMSDIRVSLAAMYGHSVFCRHDYASTSVHVHLEIIVDLEHMFYTLLRTSDFVPK